LISPEGYKLGTLCIVSPDVRPGGLSTKEQEMLHEMAGVVVSTMVARRHRLLKEEYENKFHQLARTFLDTTQNLEQVKSDIDSVMARNSWGMDPNEFNSMTRASNVLETQSMMCTSVIRNVLEDVPLPTKHDGPNDDVDNDMRESFCMTDGDNLVLKKPPTTTDMKKLFDNINAVVSNFPRQDAVSVEVDKSVPKTIVCDDLLLFRAVLNLLTHCMGASKEGEHSGIRMRRMKKENDELLVQCLLGGKAVSRQTAKNLFDNKDSLLSPVASIVRSMGGHYGMFEARWNPQNSQSPVQSIFWIQFPYDLPSDKKSRPEKFHRSLLKIHPKPEVVTSTDNNKDGKKDLAMDPFRAALLQQGCGRVH
jgi:hypothetical protein